jgi:hypothetical protein
MMKSESYCKICKLKREYSQTIYCKIHNKGKSMLKDSYELWLKAYGTLSWEIFLQKLLSLEDLVGDIIREVIEFEVYFKQT